MPEVASQTLLHLLRSQNLHPVLVDVGAAGSPPALWKALAGQAIYVGFDPEPATSEPSARANYFRYHLISRALTADPRQASTTFYRTALSCCSSTLPPKTDELAKYAFADYFQVVAEECLAVTTLAQELTALGLQQIHWLKLDTQGQDLRLYASLPENVRDNVLAVDVEPGLMNAYQQEDLFGDCQRCLTNAGYWLSRLEPHGTARIHARTRRWLTALGADPDVGSLEQRIRPTPGWCNARYLREVAWLDRQRLPRSAYQLLAVFALLDDQPGYALDVLLHHDERFGADVWSDRCKQLLVTQLCPPAAPLAGFVRRLVYKLVRRHALASSSLNEVA